MDSTRDRFYKVRIGEVWELRGTSTRQHPDGFSYIGVVVMDDQEAKRHLLLTLNDDANPLRRRRIGAIRGTMGGLAGGGSRDTVRRTRRHGLGLHTDTLCVVIDNYSNDVEGHQMWTFRHYLNLETGEIDWFMPDSWFERKSTRYL